MLENISVAVLKILFEKCVCKIKGGLEIVLEVFKKCVSKNQNQTNGAVVLQSLFGASMEQERDSRVTKAFIAMKNIGIGAQTVKPVLKRLLKLYNRDWTLIEDDNYRTLADAIFECENDKVSHLLSAIEFTAVDVKIVFDRILHGNTRTVAFSLLHSFHTVVL